MLTSSTCYSSLGFNTRCGSVPQLLLILLILNQPPQPFTSTPTHVRIHNQTLSVTSHQSNIWRRSYIGAKCLLATSSSSPDGPRHSHRRSDFVRPQYRLQEHSWGQQLPGRTGRGAPKTPAPPSSRARGSPSGSWEGWGCQLWSSRTVGWLGDATTPEQYTQLRTQACTGSKGILRNFSLRSLFSKHLPAALAHTQTHTHTLIIGTKARKAVCGPLNTSSTLPSRAPAAHLAYHLCHSPQCDR